MADRRPRSATAEALADRRAQLLAQLLSTKGGQNMAKEYAIAIFGEPPKPGAQPTVYRAGLTRGELLDKAALFIEFGETWETPYIVITGKPKEAAAGQAAQTFSAATG